MTSLLIRDSKYMSPKNNIFLVWILIILFTVALGSISYYELQREKSYLLELAHSEGLNIAFSIQALGSEFIVNRNVLTEILTLFQKEGIAFIDILDQSGAVRMSTDRLRLNEQTNIQFPGKINYFEIRDHNNKRTLQIIKPFEFSDRFSSDLFGFLFLRDKYLSIGINLEGYYQRYNQIKQRVILNYAVILIVLLSGIFMAFRLQENIIVKRTLQNMKDYTSKLLETMDSGVLSVDQKNIIRTINRKSEEIFQVRREEVLNRNAEEVVPIKIGGKSIYELGLVKRKKIEQETEIITKDGVHKILEINTSFLEGEKNQPGGMVVLIRDITRLKKLSEEINRNKRLVSLGQIASAIAHEIRNPLSSIRGLTQFLFQSCPDEEERKGDLKIIMKEVDRLNQLINQVLDFSRPKKLNISHFSLSEMIKDLINLLKLKDREKAVQFQLSLESSVQSIFADQDQIRQVLMNIILNAIQAVDSQGKIVIDLQPSYCNGKEAVLISIKDNGAGIRKEELNHIFDPFFTTGGQGTGLGLSIAYNIIEAHRGSIAISSEQGRGTEVKIFIPIGDGRKNE